MTTRPTARALNKPLLIAGIERRMLGLCFVMATIFGANVPDYTLLRFVPMQAIVAVALFCAMAAIGRFATRKDDRLFQIAPSIWRQKAIYSPLHREPFVMEIV